MANCNPPSNPRPDARDLWDRYWAAGRSDAARNALMEFYLPLVKYAAVQVAAKRGGGRRAWSGDVDDFLQLGAFGLRDAIRGFDAARGVKFETYAMRRIRGAMLDGLKAAQWLPRDIRKDVKRLAGAEERAAAGDGAAPLAGMAERLGVRPEAVHALRGHAARMRVGTLDGDAADAGGARLDVLADHREDAPAAAAQRADVRDLFLRGLNRTERRLLILYYYENLSMREIGDVLGISCTRVSQIHTAILATVRERLTERVAGRGGRVLADTEI
jgi:RNA polymerase sigma factor for flagellar operon FliA